MTRVNKKLSKEETEELNAVYSSKAKESDLKDIATTLNKRFKPNKKQCEFIEVIKSNTVTICHGSAGTGKTAVSIYQGLLEAIKDRKKLMVVRPIVESSTNGLGFLPGELNDKVEPYFKPIKYLLQDMVGESSMKDLIRMGKLEFEIVNFIRGATLNNRIIICDEAQNFTLDEMMLLITRLGKTSKIVFVGDFYQSDLRKAKGSIMDLANLISTVEGVSKFTFTNKDVVRNPLLVEITRIWEEYKIEKGI